MLAGKSRAAPSAMVKQIRVELVMRLGLVSEREAVTDAILDEYVRLFNRQLPPSHVRAVAALFGWLPPDMDKAPVSEASPVLAPLELQ